MEAAVVASVPDRARAISRASAFESIGFGRKPMGIRLGSNNAVSVVKPPTRSTAIGTMCCWSVD